ncbi:MAG: hypothetical protein ACTSQE_04740 [Candidatus Heimdallarchaeaceae archaeon]
MQPLARLTNLQTLNLSNHNKLTDFYYKGLTLS